LRSESSETDDRAPFVRALVGDGRPLLLTVAGGLLFAGGFALFLAITGDLLPQDVHYLGMTADDLCQIASCRIVDFMVHDRAAFGGTLFALGVLYVWLVVFPLSRGEAWAWWTLLVSGGLGFLGFLSYLGYGYLDSWHGVGTLVMLPAYAIGLVRSRRLLRGHTGWRSLLQSGGWLRPWDRVAIGRAVLLAGAVAIAGGGLAILRVGIGVTFVPEDLEFMGLTAEQLRAINPRLVPLLAHDRAGFGSGVLTLGLVTALCLWCGRLSRHLHQAVLVAGTVSLVSAIGVHFAVGYTDVWHLLPALVAAGCLVVGLALEHPGFRRDPSGPSPPPGPLTSSRRPGAPTTHH
jgi:hypothetical protein